MKKKIISIIVAMSLMIGTCITVYADTGTYNSTSNVECIKLTKELTENIIKSNRVYLQNNAEKFSSSCYERLSNLLDENKFKGYDRIKEAVVERVEANKSSTGDTVLFVNVKVIPDECDYNVMYLFEFHVNSDNKIYGYNIWVY